MGRWRIESDSKLVLQVFAAAPTNTADAAAAEPAGAAGVGACVVAAAAAVACTAAADNVADAAVDFRTAADAAAESSV